MENAQAQQVPDFSNMGTHLRAAVLAEAARVIYVLMSSDSLQAAAALFLEQGLAYEPTLFLSLVFLYILSRWVNALPPGRALQLQFVAINTVCLLVSVSVAAFFEKADWFYLFKALLLTNVIGLMLFVYFNWRHLYLSPTIAGAQLIALQARIQPHFLFNSINSVLSLMTLDVKKAERMLEDLSDLFRALISDARTLVPLRDEISLAKAYASIEEIRYGERLKVEWDIDEHLPDFKTPPFILQPLLENAITHGIAALESPGTIVVRIVRTDAQILISVVNPIVDQQTSRKGSGSALENIRQRLAYHFDLEAQMSLQRREKYFVAEVRMPLRTFTPRGNDQ